MVKIVGVTPGDPASGRVWSGISRRLLSALEAQGSLAGAVDTRPPLADIAEKLASFSPSRDRWRQRFFSRSSIVSPLARRAWCFRGTRQLEALQVPADAVLQFGGWTDLRRYRSLGELLRCSYHDGNLATYLRHPELVLDRDSGGVRRAWRFERNLYDSLDLILTMSDWVARSFVEDFAQDPGKVVTVHAGANLDRPPEPEARSFERPRLLFVGKGDFNRKGGPEVLAAFERLRRRWPDAELWLVGQPRPRSTTAGVTWFGLIAKDTPAGAAELERLYREATLYVMPSVYEPFGIAFLEAMSHGLPCVGGNTCAMPEIIDEGVTGYVVPARDPVALSERLELLASDPTRARAMGEAGRLRFLERYSWATVAQRIEEAIASRLL